jgi:hypothetical protein
MVKMKKMKMLYQVYQKMIFLIKKERNYKILNRAHQYYKTDEDGDINVDAAKIMYD